MKPDEIKYLLGGYATGTLTPEERKALFDAALDDQQLFEALASEQALKEALDEPLVRRELIAALENPPSWRDRVQDSLQWATPAAMPVTSAANAPVPSRRVRRLNWRYSLAGAGLLAAAALTVIAILDSGRENRAAMEMARNVPPPPLSSPSSPSTAPAPAPLPEDRAGKKTVASGPRSAGFIARRREIEIPAPVTLEPPAAIPAAPPRAVSEAIAPSAPIPPPPMKADQMRASFAAGQAPANQARDLFYGPGARPGVAGGVVGGVPMAAMSGAAKAKTSAADNAGSNAPEPPRAAIQPLGLRYSARASQDGPPQLAVESNSDAVLYVFRRDGNGDWLAVNGGGTSLSAHVPATTGSILLDTAAAPPRSLLILSRSALVDLAQTGPALTAAVEKLRIRNESARLLTQDTNGSTYVVAPRPSAIAVIPLSIP